MSLQNISENAPLGDARVSGEGSFRASNVSTSNSSAFRTAAKNVRKAIRFTKSDLVYNKADLEFKFLQAAAQGRNSDLRVLLSHGQVDVNCLDKEGRTAMHYAASKGQGEAVGLLISAKASPNIQDDYGCTPLHYCAGILSEVCVRTLLQANADPMLEDSFGRTPLSLAVQAAPLKSDREAAHCIALLVKATVQSNTPPDGGTLDHVKLMDSSLVNYALSIGDHPVTINVLAELGAHIIRPDSHGRSPLYYAIVNNRPNSIRELLARGCPWVAHEGRGLNALHVAALQGNLPITRVITDAARKSGVLKELLTATDLAGMTCLHYAASQGHAEVASVLCTVGADPNASDAVNGMTPLHVALLSGKTAVAEPLLKAGAQMTALDRMGRSLLHAAAACEGNDEATRVAALVPRLIEGGCDPSQVDSEGLSCVHLAAQKGSVPLLKALMQHGADPLAGDTEGRKPLHWAAHSGYIDAFAHLADLMRARGVDPVESTTNSGRTVLHLAAQGRPELLATLLETGFEPFINRADTLGGHTPLHLAADCGDPDCVALLIDSPECQVDVQDREGKTPLHVASIGGHIGCLRILLDKGANIAAVSKSGFTALHYAAEAGNAQTCLLLARENADVNGTVPQGNRTPLNLAAAKGHTLCCVSLLRMGADPSALDAVGRTATANALQGGFKDTARVLEEEIRRMRTFDD